MTAAPIVNRPVWPEGVSLLFGIGAQKAGTTWLYHYLRQHPACRRGPMKEMHYFDTIAGVGQLSQAKVIGQPKRAASVRALFKRPDPYHRAYIELMTEKLEPGAVALDITPSYALVDAETMRQMAALGDTRFLFLMREPVARLWSSLRMRIAKRVDDPAEFEKACQARLDRMLEKGNMKLFAKSDYVTTLERLEAAVPAERRLVMFFEDLFRPESAGLICDFLGIERRSPADVGVRNKGLSASMRPEQMEKLVAILRPQYDAACTRFGDAVPQAWHARFAPQPAMGG